jgi:curli biogenesis system outer membrane secretion channel CsgG
MKRRCYILLSTVFLFALVFAAGCATGPSLFSRALPNNDWPKKRIMVMPAINLTGLPSDELVDTKTEEAGTILQKSGLFIVYQHNKTEQPYSFQVGKPVDPELLRVSQERGMNALVFETVNPIEVNLVRKGIWPFRARAQRFTVSVNIDIVDVNTGTVILGEDIAKDITFSGEEIRTETEETPYAEKKARALKECLPEILKKAARSATHSLNQQVWTGRIVSLDKQGIVVDAGRDVGLRPGVVLEVFCAGEYITSCTGQTYELPGVKVGEIKIVALKTHHSFAEAVKGTDYQPGQIVRVKD